MNTERVLPFRIPSPKAALTISSPVRLSSIWPGLESVSGMRNFLAQEAQICPWFHLRPNLVEEMVNGENPPELFHDVHSLVVPFNKFGVSMGDCGERDKRQFIFFEVLPERGIVKFIDCETATPELDGAWVASYFYYPLLMPSTTSSTSIQIALDEKMVVKKLLTGECIDTDAETIVWPIMGPAKVFLKLCRLLESTRVNTTLCDSGAELSRSESRRIKNSSDIHISRFYYVDIRPGDTPAQALRKACHSHAKRAHDVRGHLRRLPSGKTIQVRSHRRGAGEYKPSQYRILQGASIMREPV